MLHIETVLRSYL